MADDINRYRAFDRPHAIPPASRARIEGAMQAAYDEARSASPPNVESEIEVHVIDEAPSRRPRAGLVLAMVAVLAVALVAGSALYVSEPSTISSTVPTTAEDPPTPTPASRAFSAAPTFPAAREQIVQAGTYQTPLLGVALEFTLDVALIVGTADPSIINLSDTPFGPDDRVFGPVTGRGVSLWRLGAWNTREEAVDATYLAPGTIDPTDIDRWIAANDVIVSSEAEIDVDGLTARVIDVRIDPESTQTTDEDECGGPDRCFWYASVPDRSNSPGAAPFRQVPPMVASHSYRLWLVPLGDLEPMMVVAWSPHNESGWLDRIEDTVVASLRVGEPREPMAVAKSGRIVIGD